MSKVTILGAGLSGLVAAINLARDGEEVLVIDGEKGFGGSKLFHPSNHGTPIETKPVSDFIGIDISPCFKPITRQVIYVEDTRYVTDPGSLMGCERGRRDTSMDKLLYDIAVKDGVKFEFDRKIKDHKDLPPGSIIATGLHSEMFDSLNVPFSQVYGFHATMETDREGEVMALLDTYVTDYYYHTAINGLWYGLIFQREKFEDGELAKKATSEALEKYEGIKDVDWKPFSCRTPTGAKDNPRLFVEDKILTGSLAGAMDPLACFGIHGALMSGKVAAIAVKDKEAAQKEFDRINQFYPGAFTMRKMMEAVPDRMPMIHQMIKGQEAAAAGGKDGEPPPNPIPGMDYPVRPAKVIETKKMG